MDNSAREDTHRKVVEILKEEIGSKKILAQLIEEHLKVKMPKSYSYLKIISRIGDINRESEFCSIFKTDSYDHLISIYRNKQILSFFTIEELRLVGKSLCEEKYDPSDRDTLVSTISRNAMEESLIHEFLKLRKMEKIQSTLIVQQSRRWVIGPLGLKRSIVSRGTNAVDIVEFLDRYIEFPSPFTMFLKQLEHKNAHDQKSIITGEFGKYKCIQHALIVSNDDNILDTVNGLIDRAIVKITEIKRLDGLVASPYGVFFSSDYFGYDNLVELLISHFQKDPMALDRHLRSEGFTVGSIEMRIRALCLKKTPREIIETMFGIGPALIKLGEELGLVSLDRIENSDDFYR